MSRIGILRLMLINIVPIKGPSNILIIIYHINNGKQLCPNVTLFIFVFFWLKVPSVTLLIMIGAIDL